MGAGGLPTVRAVSGNELDNVELWVLFGFDWIGRGSTFAAALDRTPYGGSAMIVCAEKPAERVTPEVGPRLPIVFRESLQQDQLLPLELREQS